MNDLIRLARNSRVYDLAQPLRAGVPHFPTHPPFALSLTKLHGEYQWANGGSSASELISMGGHTGTHIDALNHFSCCGRLHGGVPLTQSSAGGVEPHSAATIQPIARRGVLADIARHEGVDVLPPDFVVTPEHLDALAPDVEAGDVVVLRTGWARYWDDARKFVTAGLGIQPTGPGPRLAAAQWLSRRKVFAAGSDTLAFERVPSPVMEVHVHLLVESGIHIVENLNLEELARDGVAEFLFVCAPLAIAGGTGSPVRPMALVC
jgi:kynurenine formamidase